ncbi:MAG: DNA gyrase inhibitor YacG [Alphaproteobacteria bacterium]|nr:DNA gyrase inhibitor YacG [Alphaproteobacteria bacterium]
MSRANKNDRIVTLRRAGGKCPVCRRPATLDHRPFCSKHCADLDLARWLGEQYRVKTDEQPETEQAADDDT